MEIDKEFNILDILEVNDKDFSVTLSMYLGVSWEDLKLTEQMACAAKPCNIPVDTEILPYIWRPDLYIYNLQSIQVLQILSRFEGMFNINLFTNWI